MPECVFFSGCTLSSSLVIYNKKGITIISNIESQYTCIISLKLIADFLKIKLIETYRIVTNKDANRISIWKV